MMKTLSRHTRRIGTLSAASVVLACMALAGCERDPTPKLAAADMNTPATTTAQADTGTAMGTGSVTGPAEGGGLTPSNTLGSAHPGMGGAMGTTTTAQDSSFDALTRDNPTAAGVPTASGAGPTATPTTAGPLNSAEQRFIAEAGAKSLFDIKVSELAAEKASDPALKSYAAMVAADQKGAGEELKRLAAGHGVNLPQTLLPQDQKTLSALQNANGQAFDKQYLQTAGVTEHEKVIASFEKASTDAQNPAVKDYVQSTLPTLKAHLDAARKLQVKG